MMSRSLGALFSFATASTEGAPQSWLGAFAEYVFSPEAIGALALNVTAAGLAFAELGGWYDGSFDTIEICSATS